tara:strand:+ start:896 stop:2458 length:1563 start_codon:yes stop_codon:yes gene_type:complete
MPYIGDGGGGLSSAKGATLLSKKGKPKLSVTKSINYSASTNDLLLDVSKSASASAQKTGDIAHVDILNSGDSPALTVFEFKQWTDEDTMTAASRFVHFLLNPGERISMPATRGLITDDDTDMLEGDVVTATAPDSNEYIDSTANADSATSSGIVGSASSTTLYLEPYTDATTNTANLFRVGDLIRATNEIMEVTAIGSKADLANNTLTVKRGVYGSTAASDHTDADAILLPFFNAYHDYDKYTVAQTDNLGRFKAMNFFGYGRATTSLAGITPGSVAIQFYTQGYQSLGLSDVSSNTKTGLTASTTYYFTIAVDGGSTIELNITTDASDLTFGNLVSKIQNALDAQYYTAGNLFEKKVNCSIERGDVVFRSGSKLSGSAIALTAGTSGAGDSVRFFAQANGRIPALANVPSAVNARLETETSFDPVTYSESYKDIFLTDNGLGDLVYKKRIVGSINYESGAIDWQIGSCPNAEFVVSVLHSSPLSGKQDSTDSAKSNSLIAVYGNAVQQKGAATLQVEAR